METLSKLLDECERARAASNWIKLQEISINIFRFLHKTSNLDYLTLVEIVKNYLSSIVGSGHFLTLLSGEDNASYQLGLSKLERFLRHGNYRFEKVDSLVQSAQQIALLSLNPTARNRNKISRHLRVIARPDIAIVICNQILEISRLNYYALTVLCGAYCDLSQFDKAIESAERALRFEPVDGKTYVLNALCRAHTQKFKSNGDISEIEKALDYAHQSIDLKIDSYSANVFIAAAIASSDSIEIKQAQDVLAKAEPGFSKPDIEAMFQAYQAAQALAPKSSVVEAIDELEDDIRVGVFDSLLELVRRDQGFSPSILQVRNMPERFNTEGWFLQGMSNIPCPICDTISLNAYRKHFRRYGRIMHYWCFVCHECKTATDSKDYERRDFEHISGDLEERFPVNMFCSLCD
jgi:tetratricopeptide (TPR) repeat protein